MFVTYIAWAKFYKHILESYFMRSVVPVLGLLLLHYHRNCKAYCSQCRPILWKIISFPIILSHIVGSYSLCLSPTKPCWQNLRVHYKITLLIKTDWKMSHNMTKPTKWVCAQQRVGSAWVSTHFDQSSLSAWRTFGFLATHWVHSEDSDQTGQMPRLIWVFAGCTLILLVLSCHSSNEWSCCSLLCWYILARIWQKGP